LGSIASSADGTKLVAADYGAYNASGGPIFTSTNSGITWRSNEVQRLSWQWVATSADGTKLAAVAPTGATYNYRHLVYVSTNSGTTWTLSSNAPSTFWIASSADGTKLAATSLDTVNNSRSVYTSTNSGETWMKKTTTNLAVYWIASSADGTKLFVSATEFPIPFYPASDIYASTNSGRDWQKTGAPVMDQYQGGWNYISCSADGRKLVAIAVRGLVYVSIDSGTTWTLTSVPYRDWTSAASSADGRNLMVVGSGIYTSTDSGATWNLIAAPVQIWDAVASSADGNKVIVGGSNTLLYSLQSTPTPSLDITNSNGSLIFSWLVPSMNFTLYKSSDLTSMSWTIVTNPPILNLTNLHHEVTLPLPGGKEFYRLATP
jgi:hypothetical protein